MQTAIDLAFADGEYTFDLGLAQINEIQIKCGVGIGQVYARLLKGRYLMNDTAFGNPLEGEYRIEDIVAVIRQGLIGGGRGIVDGAEVKVTTYRANELIENYVLPRPLRDAWTLATAIMTARIEGYTPPEPKKPADPKKKAPRRRVKAGSTMPGPSPTAP